MVDDDTPLEGLRSASIARVILRQVVATFSGIDEEVQQFEDEIDEVPELTLIFENKLL